MRKVLKLLLLVLVYSQPTLINAQNKYAVLVAVNDYYESPGVKHPHSLHGCVNDAKAMRGLLINRFGFDDANIQTLYDEYVTQKNVIAMMTGMLSKCKAGDALVFYFSGHGVWIKNEMNAQDEVKHGMSQAAVMSDLYSPYYNCLLRDETLKKIFNGFVDKKVIVTTVFDCCYSGNLMMKPGPGRYWTCFTKQENSKNFYFGDIPYTQTLTQPKGCRVDSLGSITDTLDTDNDGVPDCKDWEINTPPSSLVDSLGIRTEPLTEDEFLALNNTPDPPAGVQQTTDDATRSFNLKDAITIQDKTRNARPSEIINSHFLSISAATDKQKGAEITDEAGMRHGAFTKALLTVYKENLSTLPVSDLLKKITDLMRQQKYEQKPTYHYEEGRAKGNFIGTSPKGFSNTISAVCTYNKVGILTIDKGVYDGVAKGNIFTNAAGNKKIEIINAFDDHATAINKTALAIKVGDGFKLTDNYAVSKPLINIFIPSTSFTVSSFKTFFNKNIIPGVELENYRDYNNFDDEGQGTSIFCDDATSLKKYYAYDKGKGFGLFYILLPVPSYLSEAFKDVVAKNQNIQIVNDQSKANMVLYLNYTKSNAGKPAGYVFYFHPPMSMQETYGYEIFSQDVVNTPTLSVEGKSLQLLSQKIADLAKKTIRCQSKSWINNYQKR